MIMEDTGAISWIATDEIPNHIVVALVYRSPCSPKQSFAISSERGPRLEVIQAAGTSRLQLS